MLVRVKFSQMPLFHFKSSLGDMRKMKNSDEKVNVKAFRDVRNRYLGGTDYSTIAILE